MSIYPYYSKDIRMFSPGLFFLANQFIFRHIVVSLTLDGFPPGNRIIQWSDNVKGSMLFNVHLMKDKRFRDADLSLDRDECLELRSVLFRTAVLPNGANHRL